MPKGRLCYVLFFTVFAFLFTSYNICYGYIEPSNRALPKSQGLTNPDLPNRTGMKVGDVTLHASTSAGMQWDSNVFLENKDDDPQYDAIFVSNSIVGIDIPLQENKLQLDYNWDWHSFSRFNSQSYLNQRARAYGEMNLTDYRFTFNESFRRYTDRPGSENTSRLRQETNDFRAGVAHQTDKFGFNIGYANKTHRFFSEDLVFVPQVDYRDRNYVSNINDTSFSYRFAPKTSLILENDYGFTNFTSKKSPDNYFDDILIGLKGDLHKNLSTTFQGGFRYQYFNSSTIMDDATVKAFICRGGFKYTVSDKDVIDLNMDRSVYDSTFLNMNYYYSNFIGLDYAHAFSKKISSKLSGTYQINRYPQEATVTASGQTKTAVRQDDLWGGGIALRYDIKNWLSAEIDYNYIQRQSNFHTFDYKDNLTMLKITGGF